MLPNFANDYKVSDEIKDKFMEYRLLKKEAYSRSPIKKITGAKHVQYIGSEIMYTIYEVKREDDQSQYFCDNDLLSINPYDLIPLGRHMKMKMNERKHPQDKVAFYRIIRCIENFIRHRAQVDFQVGLNMDINNLAISAPNVHREKVEMFPVGKVLSSPEEGVVFRRPSQKCFFRVGEAHKYSAEVVEIIKGYASLLKDEKAIEQEERVLARKIFLKLESLQKLRQLTDQLQKIVSQHPDAPF